MSSTSLYSAPSGAITTKLPIPDFGTQGPILASVVGAEPTATTYFINCPPDSEDYCFITPMTITVGPFASETLPAGAAETGIFEDHFTQSDHGGFVFNARCEMSRTVAQRCTFINNGQTLRTTATVTDSTIDSAGFKTLLHVDVTIIAGQSLLESGAATTTGAESSSTQASQTSGTQASQTSDSQTTGTESPAASGTGGAGDGSAASAWGVSRWAAVSTVALALVNGLML